MTLTDLLPRLGTTQPADAPSMGPFPGQPDGTPMLTHEGHVQSGAGLLGSSPEITDVMVAQVDREAKAQGDAATALALSEDLPSDARAAELRASLDQRLSAVRSEVDRRNGDLDTAHGELDLAPVSARAAACLLTCVPLAAGLVNGLVFLPTMNLVLSDTLKETFDNVDLMVGAASCAFGVLIPWAAVGCGWLRVAPRHLVAGAACEIGVLGLLTWARVQVLSPVVRGASAVQQALIDATGSGRSVLMFAIEALVIVIVTAIATGVSAALQQHDRRATVTAKIKRLVGLVQALKDQETALVALQTVDLATMCARDVAVHRGEKVRALVAAMMWQGMLERSQANWDALHDAPRGKGASTSRPAGRLGAVN